MPTGLTDSEKKKGHSPELSWAHARLLAQIQVNIPYRQLADRYLEMFLEGGINPEIGFDAITLDTVQVTATERVARLLAEKERTVTFHGPFMDLAPGSLDERVRKVSAGRLQRTMDLVPLFHPQSVVFHAAYDDRRHCAHRREWLARSLITWEPIIRLAEEMGVLIHLENVYEQTPEMIVTLIEEASSHSVAFCLDVGHMNAFSAVPLSEWLDALGPYLREVHLHDNDGQSDSHGHIGSGKVPFEELFQYLLETGTRPLLTLEPHAEASLWKSLDSLEKLWPWQD